MDKKFKIIAEYIKDMSSETPNIETFLYVKDKILKYNLGIEINSTPLKNNMIEVNTKLIFQDPENSQKKSHFELIYSSLIKLEENIDDKKMIEKIILCDVQNEIYPNLEKVFLDMVRNSGYKNIRIDKKIDFNKLYLSRTN
tara:strand:- start:33 stop:455 length:423 start_codon:yes stop_codon:yes gene_type:complete